MFSRHVSTEPHRFDSWHDLCFERCRPHACASTYPWFSETKVVGTSTTDSPTRMFLISPSPHSSVSCSLHVVMFLKTTLTQCRSFTMTFVAATLSMTLDAVIGVVACTSSFWSGALTCVASSLLLTAVESSGVLLATSSSPLAWTISVA